MKRQSEGEYMDLPQEAQAYADADFSAVNQAFVDALVAFVADAPADAIDLGTGPGDIPIRLAKARPLWRITGLDASDAMLAIARRKAADAGLAEQVRFLAGDAKNTGLPEKSFDVILSNSILHHIDQTGPFWAEVKRIARPVAKIFMRDLARPGSEPAARQIVENYAGGENEILKEEYYRSLLAAYTVPEVREQLDSAGLSLTVRVASDRHLDISGRI
ncbi:MAG: class I SAM-dependent methyltransferase [Planctomycetes bacterium]|nr:class I SAM-dependent methyltransferase [Planctomycetota bacterium]